MEPEFQDGDTIVINPFLKQEHNDYVVVCNEEGKATFKQLKKYGKVRALHPLNPKYDDILITNWFSVFRTRFHKKFRSFSITKSSP